jgi:hypothetical protein
VTFAGGSATSNPDTTGDELQVTVNAQEGQFLLAQHRSPSNQPIPSGWNRIVLVDSGGPGVHSAYWRLAPTSGPQTYAFTQNASSGRQGLGITVWDNVDPSKLQSTSTNAAGQPPNETQVRPGGTFSTAHPNVRQVNLYAASINDSLNVRIVGPGTQSTRYEVASPGMVDVGHTRPMITCSDRFIASGFINAPEPFGIVRRVGTETTAPGVARNGITVVLAPVV